MVQFNQLSIYNNKLTIEVSVVDDPYFEDVYLDSIIIDNQDTYIDNGPSSNPKYVHTIPDDTNTFGGSIPRKLYRITIDSLSINTKDLLFIYVKTKGAPAPDTPCGLDKEHTLGIITDMLPMYAIAMQYTNELKDNCSIPKWYTDFILRLKALELSLKTGNYNKAIEFYKKLNTKTFNIGGSRCGC
jgi:hypothetical protein